MTDEEVRVKYKATADFSAVYREALKARSALAAMNVEAAKADKASSHNSAAGISDRKKSTAAVAAETAALAALTKARRADIGASASHTASIRGETVARSAANKAAREAVAAASAVTRAKKDETQAHDESARAIRGVSAAHGAVDSAIRRTTRSTEDASRASRRVAGDMRNAGVEANGLAARVERAVSSLFHLKNMGGAVSGALTGLGKGVQAIGAGLSALTIPTNMVGGITALVGAVGPLAAGVGSLGGAAIGAASSLGELGSAAIGIVPALAGALGIVSALKTAMHGVGGAITAGIALADAPAPATPAGAAKASRASSKKAAAATKTPVQSPFHLTGVEQVTRAQQAYGRAIQDVKFSEQNLFDARKSYTRQVQDLTEAVEQYTDATKAADVASVESAKENYANVLASSASTKAQKDAARAAIAQAQEQQENDATQNQRNVADLSELKRGGINNNQSVVDAQRGVQDAHNAARDAQLNLQNTKYNVAHPLPTAAQQAAAAAAAAAKQAKINSPGAKAASAFNDAMKQLSPAAQDFVRWFLKFRDAWLVVQKAVQQAFFEKFVGDLYRVNRVLPSIKSMLVDIAGALGKVVDRIIIRVTDATWAKDFVQFGKDMKPIIADLGTIAIGLLDIFRNLTMASMPFLQNVVHWLALGTQGFSDFIAKGRKTGEIQKYLDGVFVVLKKWWEVVKNVGLTLINYGIASSSFGQWLTDGLVKMTKAWKDASELATKKGSPFKQWLDNIKPVLDNMKGLVGDFLKWFGKQSGDPKNIKGFNDALTFIRTKLAPAVGKLFDTLKNSGLLKDLGDALIAVLDAITSIMKNGGIQGFKNLYGFIKDLANWASKFVQTGFGKWLTTTLVPPLVVLAGLGFAFGPLFTLFGWLLKLSGAKGVITFLGALGKGIGGAGTQGRAASAVRGGAEAATVAKDTKALPMAARVGGAAGAEAATVAKDAKALPMAARVGGAAGEWVRAVGAGIGAVVMGIATHGKMTGTGIVAGGEAAKGALAAGKNGGLLGSVLSKIFPTGAGKGGQGPGLLEMSDAKAGHRFDHLKDFTSGEGLTGKLLLGFSALGLVNAGKEAITGKEGKKAEYVSQGIDQLTEAMKEKDPKKRGALYNKAVGGLVFPALSSIVGGGVEGAVNGASVAAEVLGPEAGPIGAIVGGVGGAVGATARDLGGIPRIQKDLGMALNPNRSKNLIRNGRDEQAQGGFAGFIGGQVAGIGDITGSMKKGGGGLGVGIANAIGDILGIKGGKGGKGGGMLADIGGGISKAWQNAIKPWQRGAKQIQDWWNNNVVKPFQHGAKQISDWWNNNVVKPFQHGAKQISDWWNNNVVKPFQRTVKKIQDWWKHEVVDTFVAFVGAIKRLWDNHVVTPFKTAIKHIRDWWDKHVVTPFKDAIKHIHDWWDKHVVTPFKTAIKHISDWWDKHVVTPFKDAIKHIHDWWDKYIVTPFKTAIKHISDWWDKYVVGTFKTAIKHIHDWWDTYVVGTFKTAIKHISDWWDKYVVGTFKTAINGIKTAWNDHVVKPIGAVAKVLTDAWNQHVVGPINKVTGGIAGFIHKVTTMDIGQMMQDFFNGIGGGGNSKGKTSSKPGSGKATGQWSSQISQALSKAGAPQSWGNDISTIIHYESGGNPTIKNTTDINARNGIPSTGLMQLIPPNFTHYAGPLKGRGITDPLANIYAGIKYIQSRYGNVSNVPGIKSLKAGNGYRWYASGGLVPGQGNSDTVRSMLTPGEFVLTKKAVAKLGLNNLNALNSGVTDLSNALSNLMMSQVRTMPGTATGQAPLRPIPAPTGGQYNTFGDINIYNPKPEPASDSLPRTVRKLAYLRQGR